MARSAKVNLFYLQLVFSYINIPSWESIVAQLGMSQPGELNYQRVPKSSAYTSAF